MQTYLLNSGNSQEIQKYVDLLKKDLHISPFDYEEIIPDPSIGIDVIRTLKQKCTRMPLVGKNRLIVLKDFDKATIEAQQSVLKLLEEPPHNTYIILTTKNSYLLLPTIVSRTQMVRFKSESSSGSETIDTTIELISSICRLTKGERLLKCTELIKTKEDTLQLLEKMKVSLQSLLRISKTFLTKKQISLLLSKTIATQRFVEKNIHLKTTIDIFFLGFPYIK